MTGTSMPFANPFFLVRPVGLQATVAIGRSLYLDTVRDEGMISPDLEKLSDSNKEPRSPTTSANRGALHRLRWLVIAVVCVAVPSIPALLVEKPYPSRFVLPFYFVAVLISTWWGGARSGLLATFLSVLAVDYLLMSPVGSLSVSRLDFERLVVLAVVSLMITALGNARNRSEARTREAERKYRNIFENAEEGIFQSTPEGRYVVANPALARMCGFESPEELISSLKDISREVYVDSARRQEFMRMLDENGIVRGFEHQAFRKDGSNIWVSVNARAVRNEDGAIRYYEGTAQDINERKRAEAKSAAFATLARKLSGARVPLEAARIIVGTADELFGWDSCTFDLYDANEDLIHAILIIDTIDGLRTEVPPALGRKPPTARGRYVIERGARLTLREAPYEFEDESLAFGDKDRPSASIMSAPIRHAVEVVGIFSIQSYQPQFYDQDALRDLEALADHCGAALNRIRAEEELRESEERFRQLSEAPFEAIILHDQGTILEVNQSFCRMYGYERAEVIGKSVLDLTPPQFHEALRQKVRSAGTGPFEGLALRKDGTIFIAELAAKPIHYQGRAVRVAAIRDITEQRRNERRQAAQHAVTRVLAESATLAEAIRQLLHVICESKRWKIGEFWRVCDSTNLLRCVETWHVPELDATSFIEASRQIEFAPGDGLPGRVWQSGQPVWIPDVTTDPSFARAAIAAEVGLRGAVAFPILVGNQTLGVMQFFSRRDPEVDEDLLKIMSAIGSQIGQFTERKRSEDELRVKDNAIESSNTPTVFADLDGRITYVNGAFLNLFGYERADEVLGRLNTEFVLRPEDIGLITESLRERGSWAGELEVKKQDGSPVCLALVAGLARDASGTPLCTMATLTDITERKRAEAAVKDSEARYRSLFENMAEGCAYCRMLFEDGRPLDFIYLAVNEAFGKLTGLSDVIGKKVSEVIPGFHESAPKFLEVYGRVALTGRPERFKAFLDPLQMWLSISVYSPAKEHFVAVFENITERQQAEAALWESEERYRDLVENSRELICTHDLDGLILSANPAAAAAVEYDLDEYVGKKTIRDLLAPEVSHQFDEYMARVCKDGATSGTMLVQTSSGERRVWEYYNSLRTEGVATPIVRGIARDITDRRRAEEALRQSERDYRGLFENAHDAILIFRPEQEIVLEVNQRACEVYGISRSEFIGLSLERISQNAERGRLRIKETLERGAFYNFETTQRRGDGTPMLLDINASVVQYKGQTAIQSINRDITERKRAEESLRKQNEYLAALHETALGLINRLDLNELLEVIVTRACELVDRPSGYVYLIEPGGTEMSVKVGVGVSRDFVGTRISKGQGVAGRIWQTGEPLVVDDYRNWEHRLPDAGYDVLRLVGAVPLRSGSRVVGVLGVESTEDALGLDQHQIEILNRFAQLASIALDNAQLHSAAQQELAERKRTEEEISSLRRELELTMNSMEEGIHRVDTQGNIAFENRAAARMLGWEVAELLGKPAHLTMHHTRNDGTPYPKEDCPIYATLRDGMPRQGADEVFWRQDGTSFPVEYKTAPMRNDRNEIVAIVVTFSDITERKRTEESLQLFRNLIDQSSDFIEVIDPITLRFIDCNESAHRSLGYSREEFLSLKVFEVDPLVDLSMVARINEQLKESGLATFEGSHRRKDGTIFPVEVSVKLVRLERDYRLAVVRDITRRKQAEAALREREAKLSAIYRAAPVGIGVDVNRVIREVNDTMCSITGYSREELIGQNSRFLFMTQEDYESVGREKDRVIAERLPKSIMTRLQRKDGRVIDVLLNAVPLDAADLSQGVTFTVLDITERKAAEEALRESEERYRELFENAKDAIYVHDLSGRYTSVNRAAVQLSGYTREEIMGKHFSNFVSPRDLKHVRTNLCRKLDEESETIYEVDMITRTGQRVPVEISSRLIYENGVAIGVQGTARDITDRKRAQEALRIYSQRLIQAQEAEREKIARELHDEIGQVLTAVRINLQSIQLSGRTNESGLRLDESIAIVDEALGRVRDLSIELRPSLLDDLGLTAALRWYVDRYAQRTGIIAEVLNGFSEDGRLPRELETACFRIAQEALTNVARHARAGSVSVQLERSRERMLLTVMDDGVGFDLGNLRRSAPAASSLGLRGMEERALAVGGHLAIDSGPGRGTRVRATFPLKRKQ